MRGDHTQRGGLIVHYQQFPKKERLARPLPWLLKDYVSQTMSSLCEMNASHVRTDAHSQRSIDVAMFIQSTSLNAMKSSRCSSLKSIAAISLCAFAFAARAITFTND